jgi:serine/threonine-protein kinase
VFDFGQEPDGLLYLVMEYVEGRDLLTVMNEEGPLDPVRIRAILGQVLAALGVAHDRGIVHRDLKPENILIASGLDDDGRRVDVVKVCDFGIAALGASDDQRLTGRGLIVGTPEYLAPEQALGETIDGRTDLYALGAVLYQLLTHRVPFRASSPVETVIEQINARVTPPSEHCPRIDPVLERICLRALQKDRRARFDNAREMRSALRELPSFAPPPSHRRKLITAAVGVFAVACAVGVIAANRGPARAEAAPVMVTEATAVSDSRELAAVKEPPIVAAAPPPPATTAAPLPKPHPVAIKKPTPPAPAPPPAPEAKPTFIDDGF